jgi:hypothetical protein
MNPQPITITPGSWWVYRGKGDGYGGTHAITSVTRECITTWSIPTAPHGHSWLGDLKRFEEDFIPAVA